MENFAGGLVAKNLPCNAGHMGWIPGPGRFHMLWEDKAPCTISTEAHPLRASAPHERPLQ